MTTLDRFYSLPQRRLLNLSGQPADQVRAVIGDYHKSNTETMPWREATRFYALNHMVADIARKYTRYETLPPDLGVIVDDYIKVLCEQSRRMSTYIMMITVRESRHHNDISPSWWAKFTERFGAPVSEFLRIGGENSGGEHAILERLETPDKFPLKDVSIGLLYEAVRHLFWENSFGSSFGGPMWGRVTEPLVDMLRGKLSLEMMVDVGYTLAHNGGPIFNKGMMFKGYKLAHLVKILDVQRAGMIPSLVEFDESVFVTASHHEFLIKARVDLAEFGTTKIDWQKVVELGAVGGYAVNAKANTNPSTPKPAPIPGNKLQITATEYVTKIKRKEFDQ